MMSGSPLSNKVYLIFPAQEYELLQGANSYPRDSALELLLHLGYTSKDGDNGLL